jgi:hypothetical protein
MSTSSPRFRTFLIPVFALAFVVGCDGSGTALSEDTGTLRLYVTDAPVHSAAEVWVRFTGVTLKPRNRPAIDFTFGEPHDIDLLALQGGIAELLLDVEALPAGHYTWVRLHVQADFDGVMDSFVLTEDGEQIELRVPSGAQSGLQLVSGFTITANQTNQFVIDWDLRKALVNPQGQPGWHLRPALRITDLTEYGTIMGRIDSALVEHGSCPNDLEGDIGNAVYLYAGHDATPVDIAGEETDPVVTGNVQWNADDSAYEYRLHFIAPGDYTVAFTCHALDDDPEVVDGLEFASPVNVTVIDDQEAVADIGTI